jgi:PAS domain S-box-containing protein
MPDTAFAQHYNFKNLSVDQGLGQSQAKSIFQDSKGFLWIGTYGGGLNRFDGTSFIQYSEDQGLPDNTVWHIDEDDDYLWICTAEGLTRFDGNNMHVYNEHDGMSSRDVWCSIGASDGSRWIGTSDAGIDIYRDGEFSALDPGNLVLSSGINYILEDSRGRFWIATLTAGLVKYENSEFTYYNLENGLTDNVVNHVAESPTGEIYVSTGTGVSIISDTGIRYITKGEIASSEIFWVLFDTNENIWYGTEHNGAFRYKDNIFTHYLESNGLGSNYIFCFLEDNFGNVWMGTDGGGIVRFMDEKFVHYTAEDGLLGNTVMDLLQDSAGNYWFATARGLTVYDGDEYVIYTEENGLSNSSLVHLHEDKQRRVWVGSRNGVTVFENEIPTAYDASNGFADVLVHHIFEDPDGLLWICSSGGIYHFIDGVFIEREVTEHALDAGIKAIVDDQNGNRWYATDNGVTRWDGVSYKRYTTEDGLTSNDVTDVWEAPNGNMWFITPKGVSLWQTDRFYTVTKREGLTSNNLYSIIFYEGCVWLGHEKGVDRVWLDDEYELKRVQHYASDAGFLGVECNASASMIDNENFLWFGTVNGATRYNPNYEQANEVAPTLVFSGLRLLYQEVDWTEHCPNITSYTGMPEGACLNYKDNHLTFDFVGIDLSQPNQVRYECMLVNFDEDWLPESAERQLTYSNLPPGEYTFRVRAGNADDVWSTPISFEFLIEAPFWKATWFYALTIPLGMLLLYLMIIARTRRLARSKRELEETVRLRMKEIIAQKAELEKLSLIASEMADGVVLFDGNGDVDWVNAGLERLVGYDLEGLKREIGSNIREVSHYPRIDDLLAGKLEEKFVQYDTALRNISGEQFWASATITPIFDGKGKLQRVVAIYRDVTLRKGAEDKLFQRDRERTASIRYAKQIQEAILPSVTRLYKTFPEAFIFYRPRDIVSGDFYWFSQVGDTFILVAADCTGHGVPGAFMSMIGNEFLHQIINNSNVIGPEQALSELDMRVKRALHQDGLDRESKDGMDIGICAINLETQVCQYAGAFNPMYVLREGELIELDAAKESIGGYSLEAKAFFTHELSLQTGDVLYLFSDGFIDQFGGPKGRKYMRKRFKELLIEISPLDMAAQHLRISNEFEQWKGKEKQVDDILILGVKIT